MASPIVLNAMVQGGIDPVPRPNWDAKRANALQQQETQQVMGQRNALFTQQQEDRQRQMHEMEREKQFEPIRNDIAVWAMAEKQGRGNEVWAQLAPKYGQDPKSDPKVIIPKFLQENPGAMRADLQQKLMEDVFAPKQQSFSDIETARHNKAMEDAALQRNQTMRERMTNPPMPKPPAGYRYGADQNLERTPGGPAELKYREAMAEDKANLDAGLSAIDATARNIDKLIGAEVDDLQTPEDETKQHPGLKATTGAFDARTPTFLEDSKDAEVLQEALRSQASIQGLANVRGSSGSIGSMTQAEWPRLESLIAALQSTQGTPQFKQNLKLYRAELAVVRRRLQNKYKETYEGGGKMPQVQQPQTQGADVDALVEMYTSGNYSGD